MSASAVEVTTASPSLEDVAPGLVAGTWAIDPMHSEVGFVVRHLMAKVRGLFREFEGTIVTAENPGESRADVSIQMTSVDTGTAFRDNHLRSSDFFGIEKFPTMTFHSTSIRPEGDGFVLTGDLTIKGVTNQVELTGEYHGTGVDQNGATRVGFEANTKINRKDFGVDTNVPLHGEKMLIGNDVSIQISIEAVLQS